MKRLLLAVLVLFALTLPACVKQVRTHPKAMPVMDVVRSPDGQLVIWNYNSGLGGTMPDYITTARWTYEGEARDQIFDSEWGRLGWVEAIGVHSTDEGRVYVVVAEDKHSTSEFQMGLFAFRLGPDLLEPVPNFFSTAIDGTADSGAAIHWEYRRLRTTARGKRPVEVKVADDGVHVFRRGEAHPLEPAGHRFIPFM